MESPFAIANYFIDKDHCLTPLKVIKLVCLSHFWYLGITKEPLICEPIIAYEYGPTIESLFNVYATKFGSDYIKFPPPVYLTKLKNDECIDVLEKIWQEHSKFTNLQLCNMLNHKKSLWWSFYKDARKFAIRCVIPDRIIEEYYAGKINEFNTHSRSISS